MKIRFLLLSVLAATLVSITGCENKIDTSGLEAQEERYFNLYVAAHYSDVNPLEDNFYYIEIEEGTGATPDTGDYVLINFLAYTIPDENVVDTYKEEWAVEHNLYNSDVLYGPYKFKVGDEIPGLQKGLENMKEGGISRILFKSDLGYGADGNGSNISPFESLMYDIELLEVIDDPYARELAQIAAYLDTIDNEVAIYDEEMDATFYYIPGVEGSGDTIADESEVEVFYAGRLLDGREFDSNLDGSSGLDVTVGEGTVVRGWDLGLKEFKYGGSGRLLIPHPLAYGETGRIISNNKYGIPPFEALLFDLAIEPLDDEEEEETK